MSRKRGLGRGFSALVGDGHSVDSVTEVTEEEKRDALQMLPVDRVRRGRYQPRRHFDPDALQELADSISSQGMVQPVVVRPVDGGFELIAGERRWRAAQIAGMDEIPGVVREMEDQAAAAIALIENIQREDLNPLEEARAISRLVEDFGLTHQQVAGAVGRSRASVSNLLRLQELDDNVKELVETGHLEMGHARALLGLKGDRQRAIARQVADRGLTVRATEQLVKRELEGDNEKPAKPPKKDADTRRMEQDLSEKLGAAVTIQTGTGGRGKLQISYNSIDELEGILEHIR
ncbi:ParB/RepB/Spo0J family partition protein [Halofilum ochraceum]|uniref:ParB/RepB/Spo0J family partition protein n=1 Tax=Halofilum ochraceum TaxID=1611323 RepID=UPI0008DA0DA9|nr:ParB/RepB/Spo0J family partition protein [Halofilum ochraceum]